MRLSSPSLLIIGAAVLLIAALIAVGVRFRVRKLYIALATGTVLYAAFYLSTYFEFSGISLFDLIGTGLIGAFVAFLTYFALRVAEQIARK